VLPSTSSSIAGGLPFMQDAYAALVVRHIHLPVCLLDGDLRIVWTNPAFEQLCNVSGNAIIGRRPEQVLPLTNTAAPDLAAMLANETPGQSTSIISLTDHGLAEAQLLTVPGSSDTPDHGLLSFTLQGAVPLTPETSADQSISRAERKILSQATGWFHAAKSVEELLNIVRQCMHSLIPEASGQLYIYSDDRRTLNLASNWGPLFINDQIDPEDCWSLRRGRAYAYGTNAIDFACPHVDDKSHPSFCLPVIAHGDTIGLMHLAFTEHSLRELSGLELKAQLDPRWDLALICAEQISLAFANVRLRQELHQQSVRDQMTGLWNRRWFLEVAERELNRALARRDQLCLISFDIDHFKNINDTYGHEAGDAVLAEVASHMTRLCEDGRSACRVGGEEFAVLAPNTRPADAVALANEIRRTIASQAMRARGAVLPTITISGGVAAIPDSGDDLIALMAAADQALYAAKKAGRNQVVTHTSMDLSEPSADC